MSIDIRETRFKFTRDKSASYPAGFIHRFEFVKIGEKPFFEAGNIRFEPRAHAIRLAKAYLDRAGFTKQRETGVSRMGTLTNQKQPCSIDII